MTSVGRDRGLSSSARDDLLFKTAGGTAVPTEQASSSSSPQQVASSSPDPAAPSGRSTTIKITHINKRGKQRVGDRVRNRSASATTTGSAEAEIDIKEISSEPILTEDIKKRQAIFEKQLQTANDRSCQLIANSALGRNRELREALKLPVRTISQRASEILNATILSAESRAFLNRMSCDLNLENERFSHRSQIIQAAQLHLSDISTADLLHDPASKLGQISRRARAGIFTPLEMPEKKQHKQAQDSNVEQNPFTAMPIVHRRVAAAPIIPTQEAPSSSSAAATSPPSGRKGVSSSSPPLTPPPPAAHIKDHNPKAHFSSAMAVLKATPPSATQRSPLAPSPSSPPNESQQSREDASPSDPSGFTIGTRGDKKISWNFMSTAKRNSVFSLHKFSGLLSGIVADRDAGAQGGKQEGGGEQEREAAL